MTTQSSNANRDASMAVKKEAAEPTPWWNRITASQVFAAAGLLVAAGWLVVPAKNSDVTEMKREVTEINGDVKAIRKDVTTLTIDMASLKSRQDGIDKRFDDWLKRLPTSSPQNSQNSRPPALYAADRPHSLRDAH